MGDLRSRLDDRDASDPNLHEMLGRLETLVDRQEERIQVLEGQLEWVQGPAAAAQFLYLFRDFPSVLL